MTDILAYDPSDDDAALGAMHAAIEAETDPHERSHLHAKLAILKIDVAARRRRRVSDAPGDDAEAGGP